MTAHTGPTQVRARQNPSTEKERWTQNPSPNQEAVCNWRLLGKGKSVAPMECLWVYPPHSRASLIFRSCWPIQPDPICAFMHVCMHAHTFLLCFVIFFVLLVFYLFVCFEGGRRRKRERMKLGGKDLGGIGGRERYTWKPLNKNKWKAVRSWEERKQGNEVLEGVS